MFVGRGPAPHEHRRGNTRRRFTTFFQRKTGWHGRLLGGFEMVRLRDCANGLSFCCGVCATEPQGNWGDVANLPQNPTSIWEKPSSPVFFILHINHNLQRPPTVRFSLQFLLCCKMQSFRDRLHNPPQRGAGLQKTTRGWICHPTSRTPFGTGNCHARNASDVTKVSRIFG